MSSSDRKVVVIFGGFGHEGLTASAGALGYDLLTPSLDDVLAKTWMKRADLLRELKQSDRLVAIVIYLHTTLLLKASTSEYRDAFLEIISQARPLRTLVFVFQDNLDGVFAMRHAETRQPMTLAEMEASLEEYQRNGWASGRLESAIERLQDYQERKQEVDGLLNKLYESGAEVVPFFIRSDVTIRLQEFLADIDQGVFLRLFVPNGRLQAEQLKGILAVLERYLREVERQPFSIDTRRSNQGVAYTFRSTIGSMDLQTLNDVFSRFDSFMRICGDDPSAAARVLQQKGLGTQEAAELVERYARDYRRLLLDMRHEFERKTLLLKQRLESDMVEGGTPPTISWSGEGASGILAAAATGARVAINIGTLSVAGSQIISREIHQLVNGDVEYNERDKELLALFERYAEPLEALQCRSDLDQLKDRSTPEPTRQNAKQRLVGFLRKAANKGVELAEKVAVAALTKHLELILKGGG